MLNPYVLGSYGLAALTKKHCEGGLGSGLPPQGRRWSRTKELLDLESSVLPQIYMDIVI